jgi:hypothetical protein
MHWTKAPDADRWHAMFDGPDADGTTWVVIIEPRGGMLDILVALGPAVSFTGTHRFTPGFGPWLWALGIRDRSGTLKLGGCGAVQSQEAAMERANGLVHGFLFARELKTSIN